MTAQPIPYRSRKRLNTALLIALVAVAAVYSGRTEASDLVIYKMTQSSRTILYDKPFASPGSPEGHRSSNSSRHFVIYQRSTSSYRLVNYGIFSTPAGRVKRYWSSGAEVFASAFETNYTGNKNYLVLSFEGGGAGTNYSETVSPERYLTTVESLVGRIRTQRLRTVLFGVVECDVPSVLRGKRNTEDLTRYADRTFKQVTETKISMRLDKRLSAAVYGMSLIDAQTAVAAFLESRGYTSLF